MSDLYAIGSNGSGQVGIGHREDVSVPKPVLFDSGAPSSPIVKVAAGGNHTLLLARSGKLYWSGDPQSGACGIQSGPTIPVFHDLLMDKGGNEHIGPVDLVAATWEASFVVARDDQDKRTKLFAFGSGPRGELGSGELLFRTPTATLVKNFPPQGTEIIDLAASISHVVAVLSNGDAYGWGNGRKSQLGDSAALVHSPRLIHGLPFKAIRAVCTKESTCFFGEPQSGRIHILGSNKWGLLAESPPAISPWRDVGASWGGLYILYQNGSIQAWGRNDHGQLPPPNLPPLRKMAVGSEHVIALSEDGDVLAWGWGEHGNCGPQVENHDVKGRYNVIVSSKLLPQGSHVAAIGAGCATSWICIETDNPT